jgi:hypothetical protein
MEILTHTTEIDYNLYKKPVSWLLIDRRHA